MRILLRERGYREGADLHYYAFPQAMHNEQAWAMRCHLPFQLFFGAGAPTAMPAGAQPLSREATQ